MRQRPSVTSLSRSNLAASATVKKTSGLTCCAAGRGRGPERCSVMLVYPSALTLGCVFPPSVSNGGGSVAQPAAQKRLAVP